MSKFKKAMSRFKRSVSGFSFNIISAVFVLIVLFSIAVCLIGYMSFTDALKREYDVTTYNMTRTATGLVDGNKIDEYLTNGIDTPGYAQSYGYLRDYCNNMDVTLVYVLKVDTNTYDSAISVFDLINDKNNKDFTGNDDDYEGRDLGQVVESKYITNYKEVYRKLYEKEIPYGTVYRTKNLRGKQPHITSIVPIYDKNGDVTALLSIQRPMSELINGRRPYIVTVVISTIFTLGIVCVLAYFYIKYQFVRPIEYAAQEAKRFAKENKKSEFHNRKKNRIYEINELGIAIDKMEDDMVKYIDSLTKATTAQKKAMVELNIAKDIQESSVPNNFPERKDVDLFAYMSPAKEVGGDFYNFVLIDDTHLGLVMADVSGKGVPAALFMMASNILLSERLRVCAKPSEALEFLNNRICIHNKTNMFVTIWVGILDITTGHVIACNAGHDDPAIYKKKGYFEVAKSKHNLAVGALEEATYEDYEFDIEKGDKIFLYTDGVVEAMNKKDELFGFDRMIEVLNANRGKSPKEIIKHVKLRVDEFANGREQFDDITMLCVELKDNQ